MRFAATAAWETYPEIELKTIRTSSERAPRSEDLLMQKESEISFSLSYLAVVCSLMISNAALSAIMMILRSVAIEWIYIFKSHDFRDSECKCSNPNTSDPNISPRNFMN